MSFFIGAFFILGIGIMITQYFLSDFPKDFSGNVSIGTNYWLTYSYK